MNYKFWVGFFRVSPFKVHKMWDEVWGEVYIPINYFKVLNISIISCGVGFTFNFQIRSPGYSKLDRPFAFAIFSCRSNNAKETYFKPSPQPTNDKRGPRVEKIVYLWKIKYFASAISPYHGRGKGKGDGERERGGRGGGDVDVAPGLNISIFFQLDFSMPNKF